MAYKGELTNFKGDRHFFTEASDHQLPCATFHLNLR